MNLNTVEVKSFKKVFLQGLTIQIICVLSSYLLVKAGIYITPALALGKTLSLPILAIMFIAALVTGRLEAKKTKELATMEFDERVGRYKKIYKSRVSWYVLNCFVSCLLYFLTSRNVFLYFGMFDVLRSFLNYPAKAVFKRDLKAEDIIFL